MNVSEVAALIDHDGDRGLLWWRERPRSMFKSDRLWRAFNAQFAGRPALAALDGDGYRSGRILGFNASAHRTMWALCHGEWPSDQIDHINGDRLDNRLVNLREATAADNARNKGMTRRNTSGRIGVFIDGKSGRWAAGIGVDGRWVHLGTWHTFEAACDVREAAEIEYGYHSNHGADRLRREEDER